MARTVLWRPAEWEAVEEANAGRGRNLVNAAYCARNRWARCQEG